MKKSLLMLSLISVLTMSSNSQSNGWSLQPGPISQNLNGVSFSDANIWIAVGNAGSIIRSSNGGINWNVISSPVTDDLHSVCMHGSIGLAVGTGGRVVRTTNSGMSWVEITRPTTRMLNSVSISDMMAVIVGIEGTILVSTDNGMTWAPHGAGTASYLFGVSVNGASSVGVGGQGTVVMSVNGGAGWGLTVISSQTTVFYGTSFVNAQTGWLVGSTVSPGNVIAKSSNAGFSWSGQTAPTTEQLFGVSFTSVDTGTAVGGGGTIIHTNNGGTTWENQTSPTTHILHGVSFVNSNLGITVGDLGTILRTTNGGLTGISINSSVPSGFGLSQNFPNPFNPSTAISFSVAKSSFVKIVIYDATGRRIAEPVNQQLNAGSYQFQWNAAGLGSGIYFYKMVAGDFSDTKKMILVK